jgi:hypothetical protein
MENQGAFVRCTVPSRIICPQVGVGGGTPRPMKLNPASIRMAFVIQRLATTTRSPSRFGTTCRLTMRPSPKPIARAMSRFPTAAHAASWTGVCPGNHESAGKRKSGNSRKGNRWLRATLIECARGAVRARHSYLAAQHHRIARRRGDKKAIAAVAHSILVAAWHILRDGVRYRELGPDHFDAWTETDSSGITPAGLADLSILVPAAAPPPAAA